MDLIYCTILSLAITLVFDVFTSVEADPNSYRTNDSQYRISSRVYDNRNRNRPIPDPRPHSLNIHDPSLDAAHGPTFGGIFPSRSPVGYSGPLYQPISLDIKRHNPEKFYYIEDHVNRTFAFFPRGPYLIYRVTKENYVIWQSDNRTFSDQVTVRYFDQGSPKVRINFITELPNFKFVELALGNTYSSHAIHYECFGNRHFFIPKFSFLIQHVIMGGRVVWSYQSGDYPEEVVLTTFVDSKPKLKVLFPRDERKPADQPPGAPSVLAPPPMPRHLLRPLSQPFAQPQAAPPPAPPNLVHVSPQHLPARSYRSDLAKLRELSASAHERVAGQVPKESGAFPRPISHMPEPPKVSVRLAEPSREVSSDSSVSTAEPMDARLITVDVNSHDRTEFYDYFEDESASIYELRDNYKLFSVTDGTDVTIWKATYPNQYGTKLVRNGIGTNTVVSKASVFLENGKILHFIKSKGKWNSRNHNVMLDLFKLHSNFEYEYTHFGKSEFFEAKYNFRFKCVKEADTIIWLSDDKDHANTAILTDVGKGVRVLVLHLLNPYYKLFKQQNGGPWVQDKLFVPIPTDLDIDRPNNTEFDIFTHIAKQGFVFNTVKDGKSLVWKADLPQNYAKRVVVTGLERGSSIVTIHHINGKIKKLFKSPDLHSFIQIEPNAKIPVTININSVTSCRAYYTFQSGNIRTFRVRDDYIIAAIREKRLKRFNRVYSRLVWKAALKTEYASRVELKVNQLGIKDIHLFLVNGEMIKIRKDLTDGFNSQTWKLVSG